MFAVNEVLVLSRDSSMPNSLVVEVCGNYSRELEGFYILLPKTSHESIKSYIKTIPQNSFILRTFEDNAINGLSLLLNYERGKSYTEEFIKIYGGTANLLATFENSVSALDNTDSFIDTSIFAETITPVDDSASVYNDPPTEILCNPDSNTIPQTIPEQVATTEVNTTQPYFKVFDEDNTISNSNSVTESAHNDNSTFDVKADNTVEPIAEETNVVEQQYSYSDVSNGYTQYYDPQYVSGYSQVNQPVEQQAYTGGYNQGYYNGYPGYAQMPVPYEMFRQQEEFFALLQTIADTLGVNNQITQTLEKSDMYNAQLAINSLQADLVKNAFIGALGLAESRNDMTSITRFLELFYTYLYETGLQ